MDRARSVEALRALDPSRPPTAEQRLPRPAWDPFDSVALQFQAGSVPRYLLHGGVGVGKSTTLAEWAARATSRSSSRR